MLKNGHEDHPPALFLGNSRRLAHGYQLPQSFYTHCDLFLGRGSNKLSLLADAPYPYREKRIWPGTKHPSLSTDCFSSSPRSGCRATSPSNEHAPSGLSGYAFGHIAQIPQASHPERRDWRCDRVDNGCRNSCSATDDIAISFNGHCARSAACSSTPSCEITALRGTTHPHASPATADLEKACLQ